MDSTAKLFQNGRSQAVRLPKAFRFKGSEVKIRKVGRQVILEPLEQTDWPKRFWDIFTPDPDFEIPAALPSNQATQWTSDWTAGGCVDIVNR